MGHTTLEIASGDAPPPWADAVVVETDDALVDAERVHSIPLRCVIELPILDTHGADDAVRIAASTQRALELAESRGAHSVVLPVLGAKGGGISMSRRAEIIVTSARDYLLAHPRSRISRVALVAPDRVTEAALVQAMTGIWQGVPLIRRRP
jgi:O-acetyl-ADP-ribose deacetylase (regulator of RNase III)